MKKELLFLMAMIILSSFVYAVECGPVPTDGCEVTVDTTFAPGTYYLQNVGINITADNVTLDCNGSTLMGYASYLPFSGGCSLQTPMIELNQKSNVTIKNCRIQYTCVTSAISLRKSSNNVIENNILKNVMRGITLTESDNNTIRNNSIYGFDRGIWLIYLDDDNIIVNNRLSNEIPFHIGWKGWECIILMNSGKNNIVINNSMTNCTDGISILGSFSNAIFGNKISSMSDCGIYIDSYAPKDVSNNEVYSNYKGICIPPENYLWHNHPNIYYNNIYNNTHNLFSEETDLIQAEENWWGTTNKNEINTTIFGLVDYLPFLCAPYPTESVSDVNGQCCKDDDNDGVCNKVDACPNTKLGEEVDQYGCSNQQFCKKQAQCGLSCDLADWKYNEPFTTYPYDCMAVIISKEGRLEPMCAGLTCAD